MGAWSADSFENDTANDWAYGLEEVDDLRLVRETIQEFLSTGEEDVEGVCAEEVIAAAEVIARLKGHFGMRDAFTEKVDKWVEAHPQDPSGDLTAMALQALDRILQPPSRLLELWEDSAEWKKSVLDLRKRVTG
jgi:hypothetical protein